jgi:23S rRNA pseudouridine1911/1915/1917 synthase
MAHIGHHIVGDQVYGKRGGRQQLPQDVGRQMLHAARLAFKHPVSGESLQFEAEIADDMRQLLEALREQSA